VSRRTANKKLTKLYGPSRKRSPKRLIVLVEPNKWSGTFKFVPAPLLAHTVTSEVKAKPVDKKAFEEIGVILSEFADVMRPGGETEMEL